MNEIIRLALLEYAYSTPAFPEMMWFAFHGPRSWWKDLISRFPQLFADYAMLRSSFQYSVSARGGVGGLQILKDTRGYRNGLPTPTTRNLLSRCNDEELLAAVRIGESALKELCPHIKSEFIRLPNWMFAEGFRFL